MAADAAALRDEFPVLARLAYLNAGNKGPVPARAAAAASARLERDLAHGRSGPEHFGHLAEAAERLRAGYAGLLGCEPAEVALTPSTTDGINTAVAQLELGPGDEVVTSDEEHAGLAAPLAAASRRRGFELCVAPFGAVADAVGARTRLVACSHVSSHTGALADVDALAATGAPVLLDGAQTLGAIPVDVRTLGCDWYAAAGQKWLCGPEGTGCLYASAERVDGALPSWPNYASLAEPDRPLEVAVHDGARRFDIGPIAGPALDWALAALELLAEAGWDAVHARGARLAARLAAELAEGGADVAPRGPSTLVSWLAPDPPALVERLAAAGVVVRPIGAGWVRASVGAWSSEDDLERLLRVALA